LNVATAGAVTVTLAGGVTIVGTTFTVTVVDTETEGSSTLVAVIVYVPVVFGVVHTFPLNDPPVADHVTLFVTPPVAVAVNACVVTAVSVVFAGAIGEIVTCCGVAVQLAVAVDPFDPFTVSVNVFAEVRFGDV